MDGRDRTRVPVTSWRLVKKLWAEGEREAERTRAGGNPCPAAGTDTPTAGPCFPSDLGELGPLWKMTDRSRWQEASRKGAGVHSLFVPHSHGVPTQGWAALVPLT